MSSKGALLFKVLLNRYHPGIHESFLKCLPRDEVKEITNQKVTSQELQYFLSWEEDLIYHTHYSWLIPVFEKLPEEWHASLIGALNLLQMQSLKNLFKLKEIQEHQSTPIKKFWLRLLLKKWNPEEALPFHYLPP